MARIMHSLSVLALLALAALVVCAPAPQAPPHPPPHSPPGQIIKILDQSYDLQPDGSYVWKYETENGIKANEVGSLKPGKEGPVVVVDGGYSYTDNEGNLIAVKYRADDERGFVAEGAHLPTPPPIPPAIQRMLEYLATLPSTPEPKYQ